MNTLFEEGFTRISIFFELKRAGTSMLDGTLLKRHLSIYSKQVGLITRKPNKYYDDDDGLFKHLNILWKWFSFDSSS
jgi:hypothetical protein